MNPVQLAQQLKSILKAVQWPSGSQEVVFGIDGVSVYSGEPTEEVIPPGFPFVLIGIGDAVPDEDHPDLREQTFALIFVAEVLGDPLGENAVIGGSIADLGSSSGRGIAEVTAAALPAVRSLTTMDGASLVVSSVSSNSTNVLGRGRHLAMCEYRLTALCTEDPYYAAPARLRFIDGEFAWASAMCTSRFDFLRFRLVEKEGTAPSEDPDDGDVIYTGEDASFTGTATPGSTYTVFADYDSRGSGVVEGTSAAVRGSYIVV